MEIGEIVGELQMACASGSREFIPLYRHDKFLYHPIFMQIKHKHNTNRYTHVGH